MNRCSVGTSWLVEVMTHGSRSCCAICLMTHIRALLSTETNGAAGTADVSHTGRSATLCLACPTGLCFNMTCQRPMDCVRPESGGTRCAYFSANGRMTVSSTCSAVTPGCCWNRVASLMGNADGRSLSRRRGQQKYMPPRPWSRTPPTKLRKRCWSRRAARTSSASGGEDGAGESGTSRHTSHCGGGTRPTARCILRRTA